MEVTKLEIDDLNLTFKKASPDKIISWAISNGKKPLVTTNFRPYEVAILHAVTSVDNSIPIIWCDTGYNTPNTYKHAEELSESLKLNIQLFVPKQTSAYRDVVMGIPDIVSPEHKLFTEQVKLEPFRRAMEVHQPDVWFTNLRKGQTAHRDSLDILSIGSDGVLKVSPFYYWNDFQLDEYLEEHNLPNEQNYYDPTKVLENRECGLHA